MIKEKILVEMKFGSHLYGTTTSKSDEDFKGVFLPTEEQVLLGKIPKSYHFETKPKGSHRKNIQGDKDIEFYSLHYFLELACEGETVALDMLHAPPEMVLKSSAVWEEIVYQRGRFYTKNLSAFVKYARRQAAKYGIKGSRMNDAKRVIGFLSIHKSEVRLEEIWGILPLGEHVRMVENPKTGDIEYQVCGRKVQKTVTVAYALSIFEKFYQNYGARAKKAAANEGIDWKAVSHALRAGYEVKEILTTGTITFPLMESQFLKEVKQGKLHFIKQVSPVLENLMDELEELTKKSDLPEKTDRKYWDNFLIYVLKREIFH